MELDLSSLQTQQLLLFYNQILEELRNRGILRTSNSPQGDYAEWLVTKKLNLTLANNSTAGYDAMDANGVRYQIKCRRVTSHNKSQQLGAIRNLDAHDFDVLIVIIFNEFFKPINVYRIPHEVIGKYAKYRTHTNAHILIIRENIKHDPLVEEISSLFQD